MRDFLAREYPSARFMPAIGVRTSTLHKWQERGYVDLGQPGTGKAVILSGEDVLFVAALHLISRAGGLLKEQTRGLRDAVAIYARQWRKALPHTPPALRHAVFKFVDHGEAGTSGEWELASEPTGPAVHIVTGCGDKAEPYLAVVDLEELLRGLVLKIEGRQT